jgi:Carboxypeptidase regulatory-like domain/TonB dependent receptor
MFGYLRAVSIGLMMIGALMAQSDRGTITGAISDPAGAVIAGAPIEVRNVATGAVHQAASTATGNYTLAQIPTGTYEMTIAVSGFKRFVRQNVALGTAQTLRVDATLEIGSSAESVTVTEQVTLLKTESGELAHNVSTNTLNNLPVLGIGGGTAGIRNPYAVLQVLPGADWRPDSSIRLNGMPSNSQAMRIEGQDSSNGISSAVQSQTQPSVDAIQEFAIQTSNYAAEFGQAGGGLFNVTMKSGSNQYHGTAYDYFVNEALNANQPFLNVRPRQRRNDYGFTFGGPIQIPHLYDGHDKTFFFFNWEQYRETQIINNVTRTVPTQAYRDGNFSGAYTTRASLTTDGLGRPVFENHIYDWRSDRLVNGVRYRDEFPGNVIPQSLLDPVALNIQKMIPLPNRAGLINNYLPNYTNSKLTGIPSLKLDHSISAKLKVSGYWSRTSTFSPQSDGLPVPITTAIPNRVTADTTRINADYTITPTTLAHFGIGLIDTTQDNTDVAYDPAAGLGLKGSNGKIFPQIQTANNNQGGVGTLGPGSVVLLRNLKPTANASLTWVRNNHTFKFGGEFQTQSFLADLQVYNSAWMAFSASTTGLPSLNGQTLASTAGFAYASFLTGRVDTGYISVPSTIRLGSNGTSFFAQDSWKVTRKLSLDYGLRYDWSTYLRANHGHMPNASVSTPNPSTGNLPGGIIFEGDGPGRCNCRFAKNYPWAFGPRVGMAYQISSKTVLRVGAGISYGRQNASNGKTNNSGSSNPYGSASYADPAYTMNDGIPYKITFPNFDPGQLPLPGTIGNPTNFIDRNAGRPARILQWSLGLQRELMRNLVVEAEYIGNRGAWWQANTMTAVNALTEPMIRARGLDLGNADDQRLLISPINSAYAIQRGFNKAPYASFPVGATVAQSLRLMPGYANVVNTWPPLGNSWYDALQAKVTKRMSHGLDFTYSFTWSKQFTIGSEHDYAYFTPITASVNDVNNRRVNKYLSGYNQPLLSVIAGNYTTPKLSFSEGAPGKVLSMIARDWTIGAVLRYGSGLPIRVPAAQSNLASYVFQGTFVNRVPGEPLLLQDLDCHCFDPNKTLVLNPKAWAQPATGRFGTAAAYYDEYRNQRRPQENMSMARQFRFGRENRFTLMMRGEFTNIFNRTQMSDPSSANSSTVGTCANAAGATVACTGEFTRYTAGFGWINTANVAAPARQGTLVARFSF